MTFLVPRLFYPHSAAITKESRESNGLQQEIVKSCCCVYGKNVSHKNQKVLYSGNKLTYYIRWVGSQTHPSFQ